MKISLKNFKCWTSKSITLNDHGIQLLAGESGKGKSSILDAIYFCLYGDIQKIVTHGQKSCEVKIQYDNIEITRSRRPNRLVVIKDEKTLEDDVAQEFINHFFGHHFSQTSYVRQNGLQNFIWLSPTEKLEFLEDSILKKFNVDSLKNKVQAQIKKAEQDINVKGGQYSTYMEIYNKTPKPEFVEFPIKCTENNRELVIKNEYTRIHNYNILIKKINTKISDARDKLYKNKNLETTISQNTIRIDQLQKQKEEYTDKLSSLSNSDSELSKLLEILEKIKIYQSYSKISEELKQESEIYHNKLKEEIENAQKSIKQIDKSELSRVEDEMESLKNKIKYIPKIRELTTEIGKLEKEIQPELDSQDVDELLYTNNLLQNKIDLYRQTLSCPCCDSRLIYRNSRLDKYDENIGNENQISEFAAQIQENKNKIDKIRKNNKTRQRLDYLRQELGRLPTLESDENLKDLTRQLEESRNQYNQLTETLNENKRLNQLLSTRKFPSLTRSKQIIDSLKIKLDTIKNVPTQSEIEGYNRDEIQDEIGHIQLNNKLRREYEKNISGINGQIESLQCELDMAQNQLTNEKIPNINTLEKKLEEYRKLLQTATENVGLIEKWKIYVRDMASYQDLEYNIKTLTQELDTARKDLTLYQKFKNHILQAETIAIKQFINSINTHVQIYLDHFFKTDQLLVKIDTEKYVKGSKATKSQINLNMEYKGYPVDMGNLSGGELSRLNLAFVLALSEIFQSPILMLDECISTLDPENCWNVLQTIRENYKGKIVVMIHHQITEGLFDNVVNV